MRDRLALRGFRRSRRDRWIAGVCGGLEARFGWSATWLRVGIVVATLVGFGLPALAYLATALLSD